MTNKSLQGNEVGEERERERGEKTNGVKPLKAEAISFVILETILDFQDVTDRDG